MGETCRSYGGRKGINRILQGNVRERDHLEDASAQGRKILKFMLKK
jgi:hypothetical protein